MRKRKELNDKTLEMMRKDKEKVLKLREKIDKAYAEIEKIKDRYEWTRYLGNGLKIDTKKSLSLARISRKSR